MASNEQLTLCSRGGSHTVTVSDDGIVYSFGSNYYGQLGLGHNKDVLSPTPIQKLAKIKQVFCGFTFTICIDERGSMWSFGNNQFGQLGTGDTEDKRIPQNIENIPPVQTVACGKAHTLIITNDKNLWSVGRNDYGQLCLGNVANQSKPQQSLYSNVSQIAASGISSVFQSNNKIYGCGYNGYGQLGTGNNLDQINASVVFKHPPNIIQISCGFYHVLFLDDEGTVFSVGKNDSGQLGLGDTRNQNILNRINNIPPIRLISCASNSSFLIDYEGNIWSFGENLYAQLGHGNKTKSFDHPNKISSLVDIEQISLGYAGYYFLAKDSQNKIFVVGNNDKGQLGTGYVRLNTIDPIELTSNYFEIWGSLFKSRAKSARK